MAAFLYAHLGWTLLIGAGVTAVLLCAYFVLYGRALAPKRGTLEWIALYDRPGLQLSRSAHPFKAICLLPLCLAAVLSAACYCVGVCLHLGSFELFTVSGGLQVLLTGSALVALTAAGGFVLLQGLTGSAPLAFFGALLLGLDLGADYAAAACFVWALTFFHRWAATDFEQKARRSFLPLVLLAALLAIGVSLATDLTAGAVVLIIGVVLVAVLRLRHTHRMDRFRGFAGTLVLFFAVFLAGILAVQALLVWLNGNAEMLGQPGFYLNALYAWLLPRGYAFTVPVYHPAVNTPLVLFGVVAAVFSLYDLKRYGKPQGLTVTLALVGGLLTITFSGVYLHGAAAIPAVICCLARAKDRGAKALRVCGLIGCFLCSAFYILLLIDPF